jgi:hypothetical protein
MNDNYWPQDQRDIESREALSKSIDSLASTLANVDMSVRKTLDIDPEADDSLPELVLDWHEEVLGDARQIALALHVAHFNDPGLEWEPLHTIKGVLSQIDNMVAGLARPAPEALLWQIMVAGPAGYVRREAFAGSNLAEALENVRKQGFAWVEDEDSGFPDVLVKMAAPEALPVAARVPEGILDALRFYANGSHFTMHDSSAWDTVSGEPQNFYEDESNTATVEDGSVAKLALQGKFFPDPEYKEPVVEGEAFIPAPEALGAAKGVELSDAEISRIAMAVEMFHSEFHKVGTDAIIKFARAILAKAKGEQA